MKAMKWTPEKQQAIEAGAQVLADRLGWNRAVSISSGYLFTLEAVNDTEWGEIVRAAEYAGRSPQPCPGCGELVGENAHYNADHMDYTACGTERRVREWDLAVHPKDCPRRMPGMRCHCDPSFDPLALFSALLLEGLAKCSASRDGHHHPAIHDGIMCCADCKLIKFHEPAPSWFDTHAAFRLPGGNCERCNFPEDTMFAHQTHAFRDAGRTFIIPPLTFTYDDDGDK